MQAVFSLVDQIHSQAVEACARYKRTEAELIDILQQVDEHRVFIKRGHPSLFAYVVGELGLSESVAYCLITVARKAREVPELKAHIRSGAITLSNARRIVPVLNSQDTSGKTGERSNFQWIKMASELSNRALEKEIIKVRPQEATRERASYVTAGRVKLELGLSEYQMLRLRRVQDVLSQSRRQPVSLEEAIQVLTSDFLGRNDPIEKAKRHQVKKGAQTAKKETQTVKSPPIVPPKEMIKTPTLEKPAPAGELVTLRVAPERVAPAPGMPGKRVPIPASVLHQVNLRDRRRCTHEGNNEKRCNQSRWVEVHHKISVSQGGENTLGNLTTLCSAHHSLWHLQEGL